MPSRYSGFVAMRTFLFAFFKEEGSCNQRFEGV